MLEHTDPPLLALCAERRSLTRVVNYKGWASSEGSLAAGGISESAGDSYQFGNGFRLDLRNSVINFMGMHKEAVLPSGP